MIVWVYDRFGYQKDCIGDLIDFTFDDEIGKLETIEFSTPGAPVQKGDYLVWQDRFSIWHEDIVASCEVTHQGSVLQHVYAEDSLVELSLSYINERDSYNFSNTVAMDRCLTGTRWRPMHVDNLGVKDIKFYHTSVYEGISKMLDKWGGEITTEKLVTSTGVYERRINWYGQSGSDYGLIFYYGFDADQIERHVELDSIYTKVHVFGKGGTEENGNLGERRLTFERINGGRDYLEDDEAKKKWGVIKADGILDHAEGSVIFQDCEDEEELLELGKKYLAEVCKPRVTYTANIAVLVNKGMDFKNARKGDTVYIRDEVLDERLQGRVMHVRTYEDGKPSEITLGNVVRTAPELWAQQVADLQKIRDRETIWDDAAFARSEWLKNLMGILNEDINATGGYVYWEYGEGLTIYDRAIDQNPTMAIQLKGGSFRIANKKNSLGEWDWETFGTGDGFTANLINVGILRCGDNIINLDNGKMYLVDGSIIDANGNYIDFGTGEWQLVNKDGKGMRFKNGELEIDADSVRIGAGSIEEWTRAELNITKDEITSEVNNYADQQVSKVSQRADEIAASVTDLAQNVQSEIKQTADSLNSTVSDLKTEIQTSVTQTVNSLEVSVTDLASKVNVTCSCTTPAATAAKVANFDPSGQQFQRKKGCIAVVTFSYANTASNPTLNVGGTGAAPIRSGSGNLPNQLTWAAGSTVIFTYTGAAWQLADSTAQNYINTHFLFDTNGMTVMSSNSSYKSRVGSGKFSILNGSNQELMYMSATGSGNNATVNYVTDSFGKLVFGTNLSKVTLNQNGFSFSSTYMGFGVNGCASVETMRLVPGSQTASTSVSFSSFALSNATIHAVDLYYTTNGSQEQRVVRVNFSGRTSSTVNLVNTYQDGGFYVVTEPVKLTRSGATISITRNKVSRVWLPAGSTIYVNTNAGTQFYITYVAVCNLPLN